MKRYKTKKIKKMIIKVYKRYDCEPESLEETVEEQLSSNITLISALAEIWSKCMTELCYFGDFLDDFDFSERQLYTELRVLLKDF